MHTGLTWQEVAIRLALTVFAGGCIGLNRGEHGQPAGLRTTILVCVAAAVSMIQANLMLATVGKANDSFITLDLMRLPLGVLSGMGFIGAGAILRRGNMVMGVTTAATLWYVTIMGLCFGGGQLGLGLAMLALGIGVLWALKWFEQRLKQDCHAVLVVTTEMDAPGEGELQGLLREAGFGLRACAVQYNKRLKTRRLRCELHWRGVAGARQTPAVIDQLALRPGVVEVQWRP